MLSIGSGATVLPAEPREPCALGLLSDDPDLRALLPEAILLRRDGQTARARAVAVVAGSRDVWRARATATASALPCLVVGDGLLRAPPVPGRRRPRLSLVALDDRYCPAGLPLLPASRLLNSVAWRSPHLMARARSGLAALINARVGGVWWAPDPGAGGLGLTADRVLVVPGPGMSANRLLELALGAHAAARIAVARQGRAAGWRAVRTLAGRHGCRVVDIVVNPWSLLEVASHVYTADREFGLLARLAGCTVHDPDEGTPDPSAAASGGAPRTVEDIFAATCLVATRYAEPFNSRLCAYEDALALVADWRRANDANRGIAACVGMSFWKRRRVGAFLASTDGMPRFVRGAARAARVARRRSGAIAVWASRAPAGLAAAAAQRAVPMLTVEDGFLRSVGLGADFMPAASLVVDHSGIYYDPTRASDLERVLGDAVFDDTLIERARRLIALMVARGITKYNVGAGVPPDLVAATGARRILVPGQVEDDRSVTLGGAGITRNLELLERVRAANRDATILYKPHPDVDAGHRRGAIADDVAARYADRVVRGVSSAAMLSVVDEVHTLTSLVGFEALLRGRPVVVYGQPFYAGWGLTADRSPLPRRRRKLTVEQLVAGTLILYPRYLDPVTRLPCGPEIIIDRLSTPQLWRAGPLVTVRRLQGAAMRWLQGLTAMRRTRP